MLRCWRLDPCFFAVLQPFSTRSVESQPSIDVVIIEATPMEKVSWQVDLLFPCGKDISVDDAIELSVVEMLSAFEDDSLVV